MEKMNVLTLVITLVVGVVLCGAMLVPVINDVTETERTFDNTAYGYYQMKEFEVGDKWERDGTTWTLNGETLTTDASDTVSIIVSNNEVVRQGGSIRGTLFGSNNLTAAEVVTVDSVDKLIFNNGTTPYDYDSGYGATNDGDYILKTYTDKAYVHGDTNLWATGVTGQAGTDSRGNLIVHIEGTINDGVTITVDKVNNGLSSNIVVSDATINYETVSGYDDLYLIDTITFTITTDYTVDEVTTSITTNATYSTFVLPKEITAERSVHLTDGQNSLIGVIPIMVIVALLMAAIGVITLRRD